MMNEGSLERRRRYLCLYLPRWPIDRWRRSRPSPETPTPLVLYEKKGGALKLYAVSREAAALGLSPGQALTDARAMVPTLAAESAEPTADLEGFLKICEQQMRYSPIVAPYEQSDIILDITGCAHLFGGEGALLDQALGRLDRCGVEVRGAVADTVGAVWAATRINGRSITPPGGVREALASFSVAALRLDAKSVENLKRFGLKTIGQLYDLPRGPLTARFGDNLNRRLDQALGRAPEPLTPLIPAPDYCTSRVFSEPISTEDSILHCLVPLAEEMEALLSRAGKGGRAFELALCRVDNTVTRLEVRTSAPTRSPSHFIRLLRNRLEDAHADFDAGFGFDLMRLSARDCEAMSVMQTRAFAETADPQSVASLVDRLSNRLGPDNILRMRRANSHLPERAVSYASALYGEKPPRPLDFCTGVSSPRPLRLLPQPEEIEVMAAVPDGPPLRFRWRRVSYRVAKASGPERIENEWWRGSVRPARDYYHVETAEGWRFWLFRAGLYGETGAAPQWLLHGFFP